MFYPGLFFFISLRGVCSCSTPGGVPCSVIGDATFISRDSYQWHLHLSSARWGWVGQLSTLSPQSRSSSTHLGRRVGVMAPPPTWGRRHISSISWRVLGGGTAATLTSPGPLCVLLLRHNFPAEGGHGLPCLSPLDHGRNYGREGEITPTIATRFAHSAAHAGQVSSVCCAESHGQAQWWHLSVRSFPILHRYSPKQPCPVSTCVTR